LAFLKWVSRNVLPWPLFLSSIQCDQPSQSLCSNKVCCVLVFYYFIQFLVGFYSPDTIFIGWAK
jgi:hypothetical protein